MRTLKCPECGGEMHLKPGREWDEDWRVCQSCGYECDITGEASEEA